MTAVRRSVERVVKKEQGDKQGRNAPGWGVPRK